jgi:hypothetical protein
MLSALRPACNDAGNATTAIWRLWQRACGSAHRSPLLSLRESLRPFDADAVRRVPLGHGPRFGPIGGLAMLSALIALLARLRVVVSIFDWSGKDAPRFIGGLISLQVCFTVALELFVPTSGLSVSQP